MGIQQFFHKLPLWLWLFLLMCLNKLDYHLTGGEEQYLAFAKQWYNPNWIPDSFTYSEFAGTRIVFQAAVGFMLSFLSFPATAFLGRLLVYLAMAFPLAKLFQKLELKQLYGLLVFQIFLMSDQSLMGGEWIIDGLEPKAIAYIFIFWSLYFVSEKEFTKASVHAALAGYFHIIASGWFFLAIGLIQLFSQPFKKTVLNSLLYIGVLAPLLAYVLPTYFLSDFEADYRLDFVYAYYRLPNHLGIFKTQDYFFSHHFDNTLYTLAGCALVALSFKRKSLFHLKQLALIGFCISILFVGIAYIDATVLDRAGKVIKYYPFRLNSISFLLLILLSAHYLQDFWVFSNVKMQKFLGFVGLVLVISQFIVNQSKAHPEVDKDFLALTQYNQQNTPPNSSFALNGFWLNDWKYQAFGRLSERDNYSVYKFVAAEKQKLNEWYRRQQKIIKLKNQNITPVEFLQTEPVDYLIDTTTYQQSELKLVESFGPYKLYMLNKK